MPDNEDALSTTLIADGREEAKVTSDFSKIEAHRATANCYYHFSSGRSVIDVKVSI